MSLIKADTLMIAYNDAIGVVFYPEKGAISTTTPAHAKIMKTVYEKYLNNILDDSDRTVFEDYIDRSFANKPVLPLAQYPNLLERLDLGRLEIMVANDCNLNCKYCYAHGGSYGLKVQRMNPPEAVKYLEALLIGRYKKVGIVTFFGGEPTIVPETILAVCDFFYKHTDSGDFLAMPTFSMVTNGTLLSPSLVEIIKKYDIHVTVSVDGPKDVHDQLRVHKDGRGTFDTIEESINMLKAAEIPPQMIEATYTALHQRLGYTKTAIRDYLQEHFGVERILIPNCTSEDEHSDLAYIGEESTLYDQLEELKIEQALSRNSLVDISCSAGTNVFTLMPNGELYPCHFFIGHSEYCLARYHNADYNFDNYPAVLDALMPAHKFKNSACKDCWAKSLCLACPASILINKEPSNGNSIFCHFERLRLIKRIISLAQKASNK